MEFRNITIHDKAIFRKYLQSRKIANSDFSFATLYLWGSPDNISFAEDNDTLFVYYHFPDFPPFFLPPMTLGSDGDYKKALNAAISEMKKLGISPDFRSVSEPYLSLIKSAFPSCIIEHSRYHDDYLYTAESLITLKGRKLHSKRNHINTFLSENTDWEYVRLTENDLDECISLYDLWYDNKISAAPDKYDERKFIQDALNNMEELELFCGGIRIKGKLKAFSIGEKLSEDTLLIHIEKADTDIPGLFALINQQFVKHEIGEMTYVNREEDMGLVGLRQAKQSYQPCGMIETHYIKIR